MSLDNPDSPASKSVLDRIRNNWVLKLFTLLALLYLLLVPFGRVKKIEPPDIAIFTLVLLFNSDLVERIAKITSKNGEFTLEFSELKQEQETQKERLDANTAIIQRLAALEQKTSENDYQKKLVYRSLITENELLQLRRLASNDEELGYKLRKSLKEELRRLRTLGFIESLPNQHIGSMPKEGDLRDYVKITERGKEYLKLVDQVNSDLPHNNVNGT